MSIEKALDLVRTGRLDEAEAAAESLSTLDRMRVHMALSYKLGDRARALDLAAQLWAACAADETVMAILVELDHPDLRGPAGELLRRYLSDGLYDVGPAWQSLRENPADLDAWRDVLSTLIVTRRSVDAVDGVAHALSERRAGFELWALLASLQMQYRVRSGVLATIALGRRAFTDAPDLRATIALMFMGLGDVAAAATELEAIREAPRSTMVDAARDAYARLRGP